MPGSRQSESGGDPRSLFESHLEEIERIVSWISRRTCLSGDDADEFRSWVHVRLMEDDFRILRAHSGRSRLETYLTVVIHNLARDYRFQRWGRWRPSAAAERRGVTAVRLETMMYRDGFSLRDATEMLRRHHGVRMTAVEVAELAGELPQRPKPVAEGGEAVEAAPGPERSDEGLKRSEASDALAAARRALHGCLAELDLEERLVLRMHYESGLTIAAIAASLGLEQRRLYTRREASLSSLRSCLGRRGVDSSQTLEALRWSEDEREVDFQLDGSQALDSGPSNHNEQWVDRVG